MSGTVPPPMTPLAVLRWLLLPLAALLLSACPRPSRAPVTRAEEALRAPKGDVRLRDDADLGSLRAGLEESLAWLALQPPGHVLVFGPRVVPAAQLRGALERLHGRLAEAAGPEALEAAVRAEFDVLESVGGETGRVLFTGYYEPTIEASLVPAPGYAAPVLAAPPDLVEVPLEPFAERFRGERVVGRLEGRRVVPYWTRADIGAGKLAPLKLELAWAKDPVALFFVEVQGSGTLRLPDGSERRIGYAGSNGRPYRSIGALLIEEGAISKEAMSMQALRAWLAAHPAEVPRVLHHNASYVFFRFLEGAALGALGRPVTPGRSVATDLRLFPRGALGFVQTRRPVALPDGRVAWQPLTRFVLNQDTGGAIRGAGRVDVFWGRGPEAELAAGMMKEEGRLFFLVPRAAAPGG